MGQTLSHYSSTIIGLYHNYKAQELPEADMAAAEPAENTPGASCDWGINQLFMQPHKNITTKLSLHGWRCGGKGMTCKEIGQKSGSIVRDGVLYFKGPMAQLYGH